MSFARALRTILRADAGRGHDRRDPPISRSVQIAVQASLTGHLYFATLAHSAMQ